GVVADRPLIRALGTPGKARRLALQALCSAERDVPEATDVIVALTLDGEDEVERRDAVAALRRLDTRRRVAALFAAARDPARRRAALEFLAEEASYAHVMQAVDDHAAVLREAIEGHDARAREVAFDVLAGVLRSDAEPAASLHVLRDLCRHADAGVRHAALRVLSLSPAHAADALPEVVGCLGDADGSVARAA